VGELRSLTRRPFAINLWVSTSDREASQISAEAIEQRIRALLKDYVELGIELPSKVELQSQNFEEQVQAAIDAGAPCAQFYLRYSAVGDIGGVSTTQNQDLPQTL
jgi:nitronate monooxygenase